MNRKKFAFSLKLIFFVLVVVFVALNLLPGYKALDYHWSDDIRVEDPQFQRALGILLGPPITDGNSFHIYNNGSEIFPAMLEAIRSAQKTITFEAYIYWSDDIGQKFIEALCEKAKSGVNVSVLVDWLGSRELKDEYKEKMKDAGIQLEIYRPPSLQNLMELNNRTHRRILVVDGKIGFTGGVGISDDWNWDGREETSKKWRDLQVRVEGPAVAYLQSTFMTNWLKLHREVPYQKNYFPPLKAQGKGSAQVFKSSYQEGSESVRLMFQFAIVAAKKSIRIASAYFLPDDLFVNEIIRARKRGVKVEIIVPGPYIDTKVVKHASKSTWGDLLKNGVQIYEYQKARYHCKFLIIDDQFASVGSTNFDNRSFRLNDEANLNVLDEKFAHRLSEVFDRDKSDSRAVTLSEWEHRPVLERVQEFLANTLQTQL